MLKIVVAVLACISEAIATNVGHPVYGVPNVSAKSTESNSGPHDAVAGADRAFHRYSNAIALQANTNQLVGHDYNEVQRGQEIFASNPNAYPSLLPYSTPSFVQDFAANTRHTEYGVPKEPAKLRETISKPYEAVALADTAFHRQYFEGSGIQANEKQLVASNHNEYQRGPDIFAANPNSHPSLLAYSMPSSVRGSGDNAEHYMYGVPIEPAKLREPISETYGVVASADTSFHKHSTAGSAIQANEKQLDARNYNEVQRGTQIYAANPNVYPSLFTYSTPNFVREPAANAGHPINGVPKEPARLMESPSVPYMAVSSAASVYQRQSAAGSGIQANEKQLFARNFNEFRRGPENFAVNPNLYSSLIAYPATSSAREQIKEGTNQNIQRTADNLFTLAKPVSYTKSKAKEDFESSNSQTPVIYSPPITKDVSGTVTASSKQVAARNYNGNSETQSLAGDIPIGYSNSTSTFSPRIEAKSNEKITTHLQNGVVTSPFESGASIIRNTLPIPQHSSTILPIAANLIVSPNFKGFSANNLAAYSLPLKYHTPDAVLGQNYNVNPLLTGFIHSATTWPPYISSGYSTVTGQTYPGYTYPYHSAALSLGYSNHIAGYNTAAYSSHPNSYYSPSTYNRPYSTAYSSRIDSYIRSPFSFL